ncbi:MAG TPA: T9SS type A sorting domain-containing protein, partial [Flavipsychrobacter sp.]|nr:T9SS type A sorting domain-containing protein [Flavipsychrobacter sp.]
NITIMKKIVTPLLLLFCTIAATAQKAWLSGSGGLSVINATNKQLTNTVCCGNMLYLTRSFDSSTIYVTHWFGDKIYYINAVTEAIVDSMTLYVGDIISDDTSDKLFASKPGGAHVYIIDPVAKTYDSIGVAGPNMLEKRPGVEEIWIMNNNQFSVLDYTGVPTVNSYPLTTGGTFARDEVRFTDDGNTAIMTEAFGNKIYKVDANTKQKLDSVTLPQVFGVEIADDNASFYASVPLQNKIYTYNIATMDPVDSVTTERNPFTMYTSPDGQELWVVDHNDDSVTVFNVANMTITHRIDLQSGGPYYLVFNTASTAVNNVVANAGLPFYPNPAEDRLYLTGNFDKVVVTDLVGRVIARYSHCSSIDVSGWQTGHYLLRLEKDGHTATYKMLKD